MLEPDVGSEGTCMTVLRNQDPAISRLDVLGDVVCMKTCLCRMASRPFHCQFVLMICILLNTYAM